MPNWDAFLFDVQRIPQIARGLVWCRHCGRSEKCSAENMRTGWPKCCGYTMTIDPPAS